MGTLLSGAHGRGTLARADDVFDLTPHEALAALGTKLSGPALRARFAWRQARKASYETEAVPEVILGRRDLAAVEPNRSPTGSWFGVPVGSGVAEGAARFIDSPERGWRLRPGGILVASTDPAWTPLFPRAAGLLRGPVATSHAEPSWRASLASRQWPGCRGSVPACATCGGRVSMVSTARLRHWNDGTGSAMNLGEAGEISDTRPRRQAVVTFTLGLTKDSAP